MILGILSPVVTLILFFRFGELGSNDAGELDGNVGVGDPLGRFAANIGE